MNKRVRLYFRKAVTLERVGRYINDLLLYQASSSVRMAAGFYLSIVKNDRSSDDWNKWQHASYRAWIYAHLLLPRPSARHPNCSRLEALHKGFSPSATLYTICWWSSSVPTLNQQYLVMLIVPLYELNRTTMYT